MIHLGLIGFGEAGFHMTENFDHEIAKLYAFDILSMEDSPRGEKIRQNAASNQITLVSSMEELIEASHILFCLTSAGSALPIAAQTVPKLKEGQIYCDLNSTSPETKEKIAALFTDSPADFVEGAIMASVPANKTKVPIYVCGPKGPKVAELINPAGMNITFLKETYGAASAAKMLKSVLFKGFIALLTETVFATDKYGITEEVLQALKHILFVEMTYEECCNYFVGTMATHSKRLSAEMEEVLSTLESMGENSIMTQATLKKMRWITEEGYNEAFPLRPSGYEEVLGYKREHQAEK